MFASSRARHLGSHDCGSLSVASVSSRDSLARRMLSLFTMEALDVGMVKGGKEYVGAQIVGRHDSVVMLVELGGQESIEKRG